MTTISADLGKKLSRLGFVCALLVVMIHCTYGRVLSPDGVFGWSQAFVYCGITRIAVPLFFAMSGFLLFRDYDGSVVWWSRKLKSRAGTLLLPYFVWSLIGLANMLFFNAFRHDSVAVQWNHAGWWLQAFGIVSPPTGMFVFWFVRVLIIGVMVAPLIGCLTKLLGATFVVLTFVLGVVFEGSNLCHFAYISLGAYLAMHWREVSTWAGKCLYRRDSVAALGIVWAMLIVAKTVCQVNGHGYGEWQFSSLAACMNIAGMACVWSGYELIKESRMWALVDRVSKAAFCVYAVHTLVSPYWQYPILHSSLAVRFPFAFVCYSYVGMVAFSMLAWRVIKRSHNRFLAYALTGGRL